MLMLPMDIGETTLIQTPQGEMGTPHRGMPILACLLSHLSHFQFRIFQRCFAQRTGPGKHQHGNGQGGAAQAGDAGQW